MIAQRYIRQPRKQYRCAMCEKIITGHHIYCYGGEEFVGKPTGIRICQSCALDKEAIVDDTYEFAVKHMTRQVEIPNSDQHQGLFSRTVRLAWVCPVCSGPRGEVFRSRSYDGSLSMMVDSWRNECGHVDYYADVRAEADANGLNKKVRHDAS